MYLLLVKVMYRFVPVPDLKTPQVETHVVEGFTRSEALLK
jgi:hypothetical protein